MKYNEWMVIKIFLPQKKNKNKNKAQIKMELKSNGKCNETFNSVKSDNFSILIEWDCFLLDMESQ
jgi:hypothetical protein